MAGEVDEFGPAAIAEEIAEALPNATLRRADELNHFGPFVDPAAIAELVREAVTL